MLVFVDVETTGLDVFSGQEIIDIGIITEFADGRVERWESFIKPERLDLAHEKALKVNGYNEAARDTVTFGVWRKDCGRSQCIF